MDYEDAIARQLADVDIDYTPELVATTAALLLPARFDLLLDADRAGEAISEVWNRTFNNDKLPGPSALLASIAVRQALAPGEAVAGPHLRGKHRWEATWCYVHVFLAGLLYVRAMALLSSGRYDVGVLALRLALDHWDVVEPWDGTIVQGKSGRIWRGKRGVARLTLARGEARTGGDTTKLLTGADQDFRLACERGDKTPEHFACHLETLVRLIDAGENRLDQADALVEEGESCGVRTREWLGNVADVLTRKAFQIRPSLAGDGEDVDAESDPESWEQARLFCEEAREVLNRALLAARRKDCFEELIKAKRGYVAISAARCRRALGEDVTRLQDEALPDLRFCGTREGRLRGGALPTTLFALARARYTAADIVGAEEYAREGVQYCRRYPDDVAEDLGTSLRALLHACRLRLILDGTSAQDLRVEIDRCLALPDHVVLKQGPLVYAARALLRGEREDDHDRVERIVRRLGGQCAAVEDVESRVWLTSHLGTLCGLLAAKGTSWTTKAHEYHRQAVELMSAAGQTVHPRNQLHLGEAGLRRAKDPAQRDPDEVEALLRESIAMLCGLLERLDVSISAEGAGAEDETGFVVPERRVASLLGEDYLRLHSVTRARADVTAAIKWLERSQELGNESVDAVGRLGDAYYQRGRDTSSVEDYRRALGSKRTARERDHGSRENWSISGACHAALWHLSGEPEEFAEAVTAMLAATEADPLWPWPFMQLAQLLSGAGAPLREVDHSGEHKDVPALLAQAARLAIETQEFRQKVLGGRSETFVLDDPHRLLSATLVLKPTTRADAAIERRRTTSLKRHLVATGAPDWMVVPEPLSEVPLVVPGDADAVYVTKRAKGTSLAELAAHFPEKVRRHVPRVVRYLARIHGWLENETARARGDHWAAVQSVVAEYGDRIGVPDSNRLGAMVVGAVPHILPAVARRDAHAENWLVTPAGQIVALDLEGDEDLPVLYEVAQLVEDHALVPLGPDGWSLRAGLCQTYLREFGHASLYVADVEAVYQAFALTRAVFVVGHVPRKVDRSSPSGSRRFAAGRVRHAVGVVEWVATTAVQPLAECAGELSGPLRAASDVVLSELG